MDNPEAEKTTVTVKGVSVSAWKQAKMNAEAHDLALGEWLSRALDLLSRHPDEVIEPSSGKAVTFHDMLEAVKVLAEAAGTLTGKGNGGSAQRARAVLDQYLAQVALEPLPRPRRAGLSIGQDSEPNRANQLNHPIRLANGQT